MLMLHAAVHSADGLADRIISRLSAVPVDVHCRLPPVRFAIAAVSMVPMLYVCVLYVNTAYYGVGFLVAGQTLQTVYYTYKLE